MFQRLKGFNLDSFLDTKIAEEQAKQGRSSPSSSSSSATTGPGSGSASKRSSSTAAAARRARPEAGSSARANKARAAQDGSASASPAVLPSKAPDPEDFVIGDDTSEPSRVATPAPAGKEDGGVTAEVKGAEVAKTTKGDVTSAVTEKTRESRDEDRLPEDVRRKLAKLEALTGKYQDLLRNYRTAHARVTAIEPFEATLREHTPLTSITEPEALVEFLNQRSLQSDMVMEELKRLSAENREVIKERDDLKVKLDDAEKRAKDAFDEAAGLKEARKAASDAKAEEKVTKDEESDPLGVTAQKAKFADNAVAAGSATDEDETFFSYETELPRLEAESKHQQEELTEQRQYIDELSTENASLRQDLDVRMLDLSAAHNKITIKERELADLSTQLSEARKHPSTPSPSLSTTTATTTATIAAGEPSPSITETSPLAADREKKKQEVQERVISHLKEEVENARDAKRMAEGRANELQFEMRKLESEAKASGEIIARLRESETSVGQMQKQVTAAERERDEARRWVEGKKGHEAAAASLRSQLKRTEQDRDAAYQMIIDCGKCAQPADKDGERVVPAVTSASAAAGDTLSHGDSEATEALGQSAETRVPAADNVAPAAAAPGGESKKSKKKKKAKAKKAETSDATSAAPESTNGQSSIQTPTSATNNAHSENPFLDPAKTEQLLNDADPETISKLMAQFFEQSVTRVSEHRQQEEQEHESLLAHHERVIEERELTIREKDSRIEALEEAVTSKTLVVEESMARLRELQAERDALKDANDDLQDSVVELGTQCTDAKFELKEASQQKIRLQEELDELLIDHEKQRKLLKDAEKQREELQTLTNSLNMQMTALKQESGAADSEQLRAVTEKLEASEAAAAALQAAKEACEEQIEELKSQHAKIGFDADETEQKLRADLETARTRQSEVEKDLAAANSLAQTRFRDLADLRQHVNASQPELKRLREELAEVKEAKTALEKSAASVTKLEAKGKDLRAEIAEYRGQVAEKNKEITTLRERAKKSDERTSALEDTYEKARRDLEQNEKMRDEAVERRERVTNDLRKAQDELKTTRTTLDELERRTRTLREEASAAREELHVKSAQQASAQSMLESLQDQTRELATQMKEMRERNDSLEEELSDAHRLLSERGREGETMRRLLADVEGRADGRVKEMRERMELALEERDRAEDEASGLGRRRAREVEEVKAKLRDAERDVAHARDAIADAERREHDGRRAEDELRRSAARAQDELVEVRAAMAQLRDALDEGERQAREAERERGALRRTIEEREARLEKLQSSSKAMGEELQSLKVAAVAAKARPASSASRSSADTGTHKEPLDYVYLKNVLLQFVEQREKKHQMQLVPVLAMLLHFDKQDEQKWLTAITAR